MPWDPDSPILDNYQMEIAPEKQIYWDEIVKRKELMDGTPKYYLMGYRLDARLRFDKSLAMETSQAKILQNIFKKGQIIMFKPWPHSKPDKEFRVKWLGGWNFRSMEGADMKLWIGEIRLEGTDIFDSPLYL